MHHFKPQPIITKQIAGRLKKNFNCIFAYFEIINNWIELNSNFLLCSIPCRKNIKIELTDCAETEKAHKMKINERGSWSGHFGIRTKKRILF